MQDRPENLHHYRCACHEDMSAWTGLGTRTQKGPRSERDSERPSGGCHRGVTGCLRHCHKPDRGGALVSQWVTPQANDGGLICLWVLPGLLAAQSNPKVGCTYRACYESGLSTTRALVSQRAHPWLSTTIPLRIVATHRCQPQMEAGWLCRFYIMDRDVPAGREIADFIANGVVHYFYRFVPSRHMDSLLTAT